MEDKVTLSIRLPKATVKGLDYLARLRAVSRQELIEQITEKAVVDAGPIPEEEEGSLPPPLMEQIFKGVAALPAGDETSLKKLAGKELWKTLAHPVKRKLGKEFKVLVLAGEIPGMQLSRLKSNNEQQYKKM